VARRAEARGAAGRLFWWKRHLYRGINRECTTFYLELFEQGTIDYLVAKALLVHTELTDLKIGEFDLVLKHKALPFVPYPLNGVQRCWSLIRRLESSSFVNGDLESTKEGKS
jgi:hypothetical protein